MEFVGPDNPNAHIVAKFKDEVRTPLMKYIKDEGGVIFMAVNTHCLTDIAINGSLLEYPGDTESTGHPKIYDITEEFVGSDNMGPNIGFSILYYINAKKHNAPILAEIQKIMENVYNAPNEGNKQKLLKDIENKKKSLWRYEQVKLNDGLRVVNTIEIMTKKEAGEISLRKFIGKSGSSPMSHVSEPMTIADSKTEKVAVSA